MIKGCTTSTACNYNSEAKEDDNSCIDPLGCDNWCPGDTTEVKELDCAGVCGGIQFIDCSGQCGLLVVDECGVCGGNNAICKDCNGVVNGSAYKDNCSICVGGNTGLEACNYDCNGYWGGDAELDACGVCGGSNTDISQCNTVCPIALELGCDNTCHPAGTQPIDDDCGICDGDNTVCAGCDGIPNSGLEIDVCGVCGGDHNCQPEDCTDGNESGYCQDLSVLQEFIDNSQGGENPPSSDMSPIELGEQSWFDGRLVAFCIIPTQEDDGINRLLPCNRDYELSGKIPSEIGNLTNLYHVDLSYNELTGEIPSEIGNLTNLSYVDLSYNELTGEIPSEIGSLMNLFILDLSANQLTGEIPESICNISDLTWGDEFSRLTQEGIDWNSYIHHNNLCPPYPECIEDYVGEQDTTNCP